MWANYVRSVSISKSCARRRLLAVDQIMKENTRILVRDGSCSFLMDNWSGQGSIADLFDVSHFMHLHVALRDLFGENGWDPSLPDELIPFVSQFSFSFSDESDYMVWEPTSSGLFTLHSAYNLLRPKQASLPSMRFVWSKRVPTFPFSHGGC